MGSKRKGTMNVRPPEGQQKSTWKLGGLEVLFNGVKPTIQMLMIKLNMERKTFDV